MSALAGLLGGVPSLLSAWWADDGAGAAPPPPVTVVTITREVPQFTSPSVVRIANLALQRIGVTEAITALDEPSTEARVVRQAWDHVRDLVLTEFPWTFATAHAALAALPVTVSPWRYVYALPADCLRPLALVTDANPPRALDVPGFTPVFAGGVPALASDTPDAVLQYVARIVEPASWPAWFQELVAWRLAVELAMPLTKDARVRQALEGQWAFARAEAQARTAQAERPAQPPRLSAFEAARGGVAATDDLWRQ